MVFRKLRKWREKRGLNYLVYNSTRQAANIAEELTELLVSPTINDEMDAFADLIIYSINAIEIAGYDARLVLNEVIKEIDSRDGEIIDNKFQKDSSTYKAKIGECKR